MGSLKLVEVLIPKRGMVKAWEVQAEPHVTMMMKRIFPRLKPAARGTFHLTHSDEVCRTLQWFLSRYALDLDEYSRFILTAKADQHKARERQVQALLSGKADPREFPLALPLREYQRVSSELAYTMKGLLLADSLGTGKAQPLDAKVLTPTGWKRMGDLCVGDPVVDPDGGIGWVEGVYPQGEREVFRVETTDGAVTECCDDHLWTFQNPDDRNRGTFRTRPLREFRENLRRTYGREEDVHLHQVFLPIMQPARFIQKGALPLDPWLLGILIGDGAFTNNAITVTKADIWLREEAAKVLPTGVSIQPRGDTITWGITGPGAGRPNAVTVALRELGLMGHLSTEKFIPRQYLFASPEERLCLLRGLMDTDGDCSTRTSGSRGLCTFNTSSPRLAADVVELVRSLGGIASMSMRKAPKYTYRGEVRTGKPAYRINIRMDVNPFSMPRKAQGWKPANMARAITSVTPAGTKPVQCILVSTKRHLYVTDGHMVTHNTLSGIGLLSMANTRPALWVTMTHLQLQAGRELDRFLPGVRWHILKRATPYPLGFEEGSSLTPPDVLIVNYAKLEGWAEALAGIVRTLVFDEAQELRHDDSKRYQAARHLREQAQWCLCLTGTPIYGYAQEILNVLNIVRPDALGTLDEFKTAWGGSLDVRGRLTVSDPRALGTHLRAEGLMIRRTRRDVGREIPAVSRTVHVVQNDPRVLAGIQGSAAELARIILAESGSGLTKMQAAGEMDRILRQATGVAKGAYVIEFVRLLLDSEDRVVVFAWHHAVYDLLEQGLKSYGVARYTGEQSVSQKDEALVRFKAGPEVYGRARVLLLSLRAGAGIDGLQFVCRTGVFAELDWSPKVMEQCLDAQTEVLTKRGFQGPDGVRSDDVVAAFDYATGAIQWLPITGRVRRPLAGDERMYSLQTPTVNLRVTGGHRMVMARFNTTQGPNYGWTGWRVVTAEQMATFNGGLRIPVAGVEKAHGVPLTDDELRFLGWFVTDGHLSRKSGQVQIAQSEMSKFYPHLKRTLDACAFQYGTYKRTKKTNYGGNAPLIVHKISRTGPKKPNGKRGWAALEPYLDKDLNDLYEALDARQLGVFLEAVYMGNGAHRAGTTGWDIITGSLVFAERLQSLCIRRGWRANVSVLPAEKSLTRTRDAYLLHVKHVDVRCLGGANSKDRAHLAEVPAIPGELVWCVANDLGTLVIRRHGKTAIVGNCEGRLGRDGQEDPCAFYVLVSADGADPVMMDVLQLKTGIADGIVDPDLDRTMDAQVDPERVKRLAEAVLGRG